MNKTFTQIFAVLALIAINSQSALAAENAPEKMTCKEFINLNPKAMLPVAWWMLHEETVYKGGDSVSLTENDLTSIPQVLEYCQRNPERNLYSFKDKPNR